LSNPLLFAEQEMRVEEEPTLSKMRKGQATPGQEIAPASEGGR
jgi:hypothetical protein